MGVPTTMVYAIDRLGNLWFLNYTTLAPITAASPYTYNPWTLQQGGANVAANASLAFDYNSTYNLFLPGIYNGSNVYLGVFSGDTSTIGQPTGTPVAMPSGSFRPISALYDGTSVIYAPDFAFGVTAWGTTSFAQPAHWPIAPGAGSGAIVAQGLAYNPNGGSPLLYTCCQNSSNQDQLAVISNLSGTPSVATHNLSTAYLASSYTGIAYDLKNDLIYITSNSPQGQGNLTVLQGTSHSSPYSQVTGSPFSTGGLDARGICCTSTASTAGYLFVCNFGSNSVAVYTTSSTGPSPISSGSPFSAGTNGPFSPIAVACYPLNTATPTTVYLANFNGVTNPVTAFTFSASTPFMTAITPGTPIPGTQFVSLVVGP